MNYLCFQVQILLTSDHDHSCNDCDYPVDHGNNHHHDDNYAGYCGGEFHVAIVELKAFNQALLLNGDFCCLAHLVHYSNGNVSVDDAYDDNDGQADC